MSKKNKKLIKLNKKNKTSIFEVKARHSIRFPILEFPLGQPNMTLALRAGVLLAFLGIFTLYVFHLMPFVPGGDSGELITSAYTLGVSHPPGYPLFNILGKLFSLIPISSIAWRINLSSAVFHLGASFFIYLSLYKLIKYWPAALLGAVFFSIFPLIWDYSLKAEVFPLNNLFAALLVYLIVTSREYYMRYQMQLLDQSNYQNRSRIMVYLTLFICGLSLTNHHTIILLAPGILLALYSYNRSVLFEPMTFLIALSAFFIGLMVYLYIPIRAHALPYINWDNAQTLEGFITLVTRKDYGSFTLIVADGEVYTLLQKYALYLSNLLVQIGPFGLFLAAMGLLFLFYQKEKKLGFVFLLLYLFSSFGFVTLTNAPLHDNFFLGVLERFYMLSLVFVALFIGLGIFFLHQSLLVYFKEKKIGLILRALILSLSLIASLMPLMTARGSNNIIYNYGHNILNSLEENALLLADGDSSVNVLVYLQQVEGLRKDMVLLTQKLLYIPWYVEQMKQRHPEINIPFQRFDTQFQTLGQLVAANIDKRPIYAQGIIASLPGLDASYQFIPTGVVTRIVKKNESLTNYIKHLEPLWQSYDLSGTRSFFPVTAFEKEALNLYASAHFNYAFEHLYVGAYDLAISEFSKALQLNKAGSIEAYKQIGDIYANKKHDSKKAIENYRAYIRLNPKNSQTNQQFLAYIQENTKLDSYPKLIH